MTAANDTEAAINRAFQKWQVSRHALSDEIVSFPTPIAECDAQFNHLLALRRDISLTLDPLEAEVFVAKPRSPAPFTGFTSG